MDPFLGFIVILIVLGIILSFIPVDPPMKAIIYKVILAVLCIVLLVWVLGIFGLMPHGSGLRVGRL